MGYERNRERKRIEILKREEKERGVGTANETINIDSKATRQQRKEEGSIRNSNKIID
jgi:hypothetical protein